MSKKIHIAILACVFLIPVVAISLYFLGPRSKTTFVCSMCGKQKVKKKCIGLTYYAKEFETDYSRWYQAKDLKPHHHDWSSASLSIQDWWGSHIHLDGIDCLYTLGLLLEAEKRADMAQFEELIEEYYTTRKDRTKIKDFVQHCKDIIGPNNTFRLESLKADDQHDI